MSVETDSHGRLYLSADLREKYGETFHVVEYEDRLELVPIDDDPLQGVRDAAGAAFDGTSRAELRDDVLEQATEEVTDDLEHAKRDAAETDE